MPELAINGGSPVRKEPYPDWPKGDDEGVAAVTEVVRSGRWGGKKLECGIHTFSERAQ